MLKKIAVVVIASIVGMLLLWLIIPAQPSIDTIKEIADITLDEGATIRAFERISESREPEFVVSIFIPEGGNKFCENNNLKKGTLSFEPLQAGGKGYELLLGSPALCSGVKPLGHGGVYIVGRQSEVVLYVDDR